MTLTYTQVQELEACAAPNWMLTSLADRCLRDACTQAFPTDELICVEMSLHYLHPAKGPLTASTELLERSGQLLFATANVIDAQGRPCLRSTATFSWAAADHGLGEFDACSAQRALN